MKNSKDYCGKIKKLFQTLKKNAPAVTPVNYDTPVDAIVYAFISAFTTEANASRIFKRVGAHFVDLNDLRVSRPEEITEVFGDMSESATASAEAMTRVLNAIFDKFDKMTLSGLTDDGKRQARKNLEEIPGMTPFTVAYTFLAALEGHAIPLTEKMVEYLVQNGMVHPESTLQEIESFLERQISAADAYTFYVLLRAEAEGGAKSAAQKTAPKPAAKKETKKTTVKKKPSKK
jgi:endonuclease III